MSDNSHFNGIEAIDYTLIASRDLNAARLVCKRLGFTVPPCGSHIEWGTGNLCIMFPDDYFEILGEVNATRFTMNLDKHLERHGEGLMGLPFELMTRKPATLKCSVTACEWQHRAG